nr:hypothetical protein Iba_chr12dCG1230 [Ipomoea batatas]
MEVSTMPRMHSTAYRRLLSLHFRSWRHATATSNWSPPAIIATTKTANSHTFAHHRSNDFHIANHRPPSPDPRSKPSASPGHPPFAGMFPFQDARKYVDSRNTPINKPSNKSRLSCRFVSKQTGPPMTLEYRLLLKADALLFISDTYGSPAASVLFSGDEVADPAVLSDELH